MTYTLTTSRFSNARTHAQKRTQTHTHAHTQTHSFCPSEFFFDARDIAQRVSEGLKGEPVTPQQALEALSKEFFTTFSLIALETEADSADPDSVLITNVAKNKRGTALGLSPLYLAAARLIGAPLRVVNCSAAVSFPARATKHSASSARAPTYFFSPSLRHCRLLSHVSVTRPDLISGRPLPTTR